MARTQKENQKNPGSAGPQKALSAAARTVCMYKHRCIHCGGLDPCLPETLIAVGTDDVPNGAPSTGALNAHTSCLDGIPSGALVGHTGEGAEWRDALPEDAAAYEEESLAGGDDAGG